MATSLALVVMGTSLALGEDSLINIVALLENVEEDPMSYRAAIKLAQDRINNNSDIMPEHQVKTYFAETKVRIVFPTRKTIMKVKRQKY